MYINDLLKELELSKSSATVLSVKSGVPSFADDISIIAVTPYDLQILIDIVYLYTCKWRFSISIDKSSIVVFPNKRSDTSVGVLLGNDFLQQSDYAIHLGIRQDSNLKLANRITERCQKAKNSFFAMAGLGLRPLGLNPLTSVSLYRKIVIPTALYGCELWNNMNKSDLDTVNRLQHFVVKKILGLPIRTRSDICESMLGLIRLSAEIEKRKLMFLHKILSLNTDTICQKLFIRKYILFISNRNSLNYGYIPDICNILEKYDLQAMINDYFKDVKLLPTKLAWKQTVNKSIYLKESQLLRERINSDSDFTFF